ncbi:MAG: carbon-nitrogen hydrolase family protein, partial [Proteobacteria bacterium]|nr:carbon-nitrogen hydrolase family protein [Pseudomonadota bacterium]
VGPYRFACVQVSAGDDMAANVDVASNFVKAAVSEGANFVGLPENVAMMVFGSKGIRANARSEQKHPALAAFRNLAAQYNVWLLIGSLTVQTGDQDGRVANRSFVIDASGEIVARYDKIHMFDVDLPNGESYRESKNFRPGAAAVVADTEFGRLGMTICYDVRFAYLYRSLAQGGAHLLSVPAAFTRVTGEAHWHTLLRARAIETGCFVVAPAQCGTHPGDRKTYGHSLIVSPWGEVLADGGTEPGFAIAEIDLDTCDRARAMVPALNHDRAYDSEPVASAPPIRAVS